MRYVYLNGEFLLESDAKLSIYDSAITTGDRTTEVVRTFAHKPFKIKQHVDRLFHGLSELNMKIDTSKEELIEKTHELLHLNVETEAANVEWQFVYIVTRGLESLFQLFDDSDRTPTLAILCFPLKYRLGSMVDKYQNGMRLLVPNQRAIPHDILPPEIKSRGRVHFKLAQLEIRARDKNASPILLDHHDCITESTGSNIFLVKENTLYTPPSFSVLSGITREYLMDLAKELGADVVEQPISIHDIKDYDEAFVTSTVIGIIHVNQLEDHRFLNGQAGPLTNKIRNYFYEKVGVNFVQQAIEYAMVTNKS